MSAQILGVMLTFATVDGQQLALTVSLTEPATAAIDWNGARQAVDQPSHVLTFRGLPVPVDQPARYRLEVPGLPPLEEVVMPPVLDGKLRIALYGDNRDGPGPHVALLEQMTRAQPSIIVHTGDVVQTALDGEGWVRYLTATFPLARRVPTILALGNHELTAPRGQGSAARTQVLSILPPVADELAQKMEAPRGVFHVRVGPVLFVSLDSNSPFGAGSKQLAYVQAVLEKKGDAQQIYLAMHHGPLSAGPHGGHPDGGPLLDLMREHRVTAVLAGHDHTYQRIAQDGAVAIVSGGGGAPLYARESRERGVAAFASTYNWALIDVDGPRSELRAFSLEGALLDRAELAPTPPPAPVERPVVEVVIAGQVLVATVLLGILYRWLRRGAPA